jgi:hypothetical protein
VVCAERAFRSSVVAFLSHPCVPPVVPVLGILS